MSVVRERRVLDLLVKVIVIAGCVEAAGAIMQRKMNFNPFDHLHLLLPIFHYNNILNGSNLRNGNIRASASAGHPIELSATMAMLVPFAAYLAIKRRNRWYWGAAVLMLAGDFAGGSRTGLITIIVMLVVYLWLRPREVVKCWPALIPLLIIVHFLDPGALGGLYAGFFPKGGLVADQSQTFVGPGGIQENASRLSRVGPVPQFPELQPVVRGRVRDTDHRPDLADHNDWGARLQHHRPEQSQWFDGQRGDPRRPVARHTARDRGARHRRLDLDLRGDDQTAGETGQARTRNGRWMANGRVSRSDSWVRVVDVLLRCIRVHPGHIPDASLDRVYRGSARASCYYGDHATPDRAGARAFVMRILILVPGDVGAHMSGPAIRAWLLAEGLAEYNEVTAAVRGRLPDQPPEKVRVFRDSRRRFLAETARHDVVMSACLPPFALTAARALGKIAVADHYDPVELQPSRRSKSGTMFAAGPGRFVGCSTGMPMSSCAPERPSANPARRPGFGGPFGSDRPRRSVSFRSACLRHRCSAVRPRFETSFQRSECPTGSSSGGGKCGAGSIPRRRSARSSRSPRLGRT